MAKRSREDFDNLSALIDSEDSPAETATKRPGILPDPRGMVDSSFKILYLEHPDYITVMRCSLPPHRETVSFPSLEEYEVHYNKFHVNRCVECKRNFPTSHFLNIHQEENHDPLVAVLRERGEKTYGCFVENCERKCSSPAKRRLHLIDKHMFPKEFDFHVVNDGIDQRSSMLRSGKHRRQSSAARLDKARRRSSTLAHASPTEENIRSTEAETGVTSMKGVVVKNAEGRMAESEVGVEELTKSMSALKFVPTSVHFGRGHGRGRGELSRR